MAWIYGLRSHDVPSIFYTPSNFNKSVYTHDILIHFLPVRLEMEMNKA